MRRSFTPRFHHIRILVLLLGASALVYGQSLGDVARENREKKAAKPPAAKVITNADLGIDPDGDATAEDARGPSTTNAATSHKTAELHAAEQRAAEQWKQKILAQKKVIADLQARVDALRAEVRSFDPDLNFNGYVFNRYQARLVERLKATEGQLAGQQQKLDDMQEAARKAGMHTAVYDP